jgi:hypothetical protein
MVRLAQGVAMAAIFAAAGCDLNALDIISRGVASGGKHAKNQSLGSRA